MPNLISPIGIRSVKDLPKRSTARRLGYFTAQIDRASLQQLSRELQSVDKKVRNQIAKKALREWGKAVRRVAKANAWKNAERTKKQLTYKVRVYKRAVWAGVGVKTEKVGRTRRAERLGRFSAYVGWKAHFMEVGWHAFPKGRSGNEERERIIARNRRIDEGGAQVRPIIAMRNGRPHIRLIKQRPIKISQTTVSGGGGRGWRRGVRGLKGVYQSQYARHYLFKAHLHGRQIAPQLIVQAINDGIRQVKGAA